MQVLPNLQISSLYLIRNRSYGHFMKFESFKKRRDNCLKSDYIQLINEKLFWELQGETYLTDIWGR